MLAAGICERRAKKNQLLGIGGCRVKEKVQSIFPQHQGHEIKHSPGVLPWRANNRINHNLQLLFFIMQI